MRVFFIDIDGVLNNCTATGAFNEDSVDEVCVAILNEALRRTNSNVVIISTWKDSFGFESVKNFLYRKGVLADSIIGATEKDLPKEDGIQKYLQHNKVDEFIIIDDALDLIDKKLKTRYFKTNSHSGLEPEEIDDITNYFK
jgi:recombinational DNA repair protein RecR